MRTGISFNDLQDLQTAEFNEPSGWVIIRLDKKFGRPHRAWMLQIAIVSNHQNGRDTHVRQVKIYAPVAENAYEHHADVSFQPKFSDSVLSSFNVLR